jgi:hypothetical protein
MIEKLPTGGRPSLDPSTNSVPVDIGKTAAEGFAQGEQGFKEFNQGLNRSSGNQQPGNSPYLPKSAGDDD